MAESLRLLVIAATLALTACGPNSKNVRVYYLEPDQGLVRKQESEVLPFPKAKGYLCENPKDFQDTVTCIHAQVKVYYLEPKEGLVRKQTGEVRPFSDSRGFLCVSPSDAQLILEDCQ